MTGACCRDSGSGLETDGHREVGIVRAGRRTLADRERVGTDADRPTRSAAAAAAAAPAESDREGTSRRSRRAARSVCSLWRCAAAHSEWLSGRVPPGT